MFKLRGRGGGGRTEKHHDTLGSFQELGGIDLSINDRNVLEVTLAGIKEGGHDF